MKLITIATVFACIALTFAAEGDTCVVAADCTGPCPDNTHHWACIIEGFRDKPHCKCRIHRDPNAVTTTTAATSTESGPSVGSTCARKSDCSIDNCADIHCVDGTCECFYYSQSNN